MREMQDRDGRTFYVMARPELEGLTGYHPTAGGRKARACCPIHDGHNRDVLEIDWERGWAKCFRCQASIRVDDRRDAYASAPARAYAPARTQKPPQREKAPPPDQSHLYDVLRSAIDRAQEALPASPGAAYLVDRGVSLEVAQAAGVGWATAGKMAGRVVFPLTLPDGTATSVTSRAIDDHTRPKYRVLPAGEGYQKTLFNGAAIGEARATGGPVVVVEGPFDALACIAGGVPLTVATCGTTYAHPEHFAGVSRALIAFDGDAAGTNALPWWVRLLAGYGVATDFLPIGTLGAAKDLGEYWQRHGTIPEAIAGYPAWAGAQVAYAALPADMRRYADDLTTSLIDDGWVAIEVLAAALPAPDALDHDATVYAIDHARMALRRRGMS